MRMDGFVVMMVSILFFVSVLLTDFVNCHQRNLVGRMVQNHSGLLGSPLELLQLWKMYFRS